MRLHLDAGRGAVEPHPAHPEPQLAQRALAGGDAGQPLGRDRGAVGEPARQAGEGRLVPHRQPEAPRRLPDVRLAEAGLVEGRAHPLLERGPAARPVVPAVVGVEPVEDVRRPEADRLGHRHRVDLDLAEIAAVDGVRRVPRVVELVGLDQHVAHPEVPREAFGPGPLLGGQARRDRGEGRRPVAEDAGRLGEEVAGIDAAREADDRPVERGEPGPQFGDPVVEACRRDIGRDHGGIAKPRPGLCITHDLQV